MAYVQSAALQPIAKILKRKSTALVPVKLPPRIRGQLLPPGSVRLRRSQLGEIGIAPLVAIAAAKKGKAVVKAIGSAVKKLTGSGPDAKKHAEREARKQTAWDRAQQGDVNAALYIRQITGHFPPVNVPGWGTVGGPNAAGDNIVLAEDRRLWQKVLRLPNGVGPRAEALFATLTGGTAPEVEPPAPPSGEIVVAPDGTVTYPSASGGGGGPAGGGTSAGPTVQEAGLFAGDTKLLAVAVGLAAVIGLVMHQSGNTRPARRRRRRR